jgi:hypothetical protein
MEAAMKTLTRKCLFAAAALAFAGAVNAQQSPESIVVESDSALYLRTDGLPPYLAARLEEKAREGLRSLNQYVQRTRMIHQLTLSQILVTREEATFIAAKEDKAHFVAIAQVD